MRNKFKKQKLTRGINPITMDQELVQRLCSKSSMLFGSKWRWRVLCGRNMIDPAELETRFDTVLEQQLNKIKEQVENEQNGNQQLGNDMGRSTTDGSGEEKEPTLSGDAGRREGEDSDSDVGNQVRSGQTDDGSTAAGSSE